MQFLSPLELFIAIPTGHVLFIHVYENRVVIVAHVGNRVFQLWPCWHLGPDNCFLWRTVLYVTGHSVAPWLLATGLSTLRLSCNIWKCLWCCQIPLGAKSFPGKERLAKENWFPRYLVVFSMFINDGHQSLLLFHTSPLPPAISTFFHFISSIPYWSIPYT